MARSSAASRICASSNRVAGPVQDGELSAYVDGETSAERRAEIEAWLARHPADKARVETFRAQADALRARFGVLEAEPRRAAFIKCPPALAACERTPLSARLARVGERRRMALAVAGAFIAGAAATLAVVLAPISLFDARVVTVSPRDAGRADAARAFAARALEAHQVFTRDAARPVEVFAAEPDALSQWLSARVGLAIAPPDLAPIGLRLLGGRVAPSDWGSAALLVYEASDGDRISLFIAKEPGLAADSRIVVSGQASAIVWGDGWSAYALVGSTSVNRLADVAHAVRAGASL